MGRTGEDAVAARRVEIEEQNVRREARAAERETPAAESPADTVEAAIERRRLRSSDRN